jgi:hypothetical protein
MDTNTVCQPQMTVEDVLSNWPGAYSAFASMKTKCVGCFLQRFCTLQDVAEAYQVPFQELTGELEKYIPTFNQTQRSSK